MAKVLVVDDDPVNREFLRTLLVHRGHSVREAQDGESALSLAGREPPDAVITDVLMPGLDGYELARLLRSQPATSHIPIAFSTAHYERREIESLARACGVQDVIVKPAHPKVVLAAVDSLLNARPGEVGHAATVEEFADEHRFALKSKLFQKAAALGLSQGRLLAIVNASRSGVLLAFDDAAATHVNVRMAEITGRPRESLLGTGWLESFDPADSDQLRAAILSGVPAEGLERRVRLLGQGEPRWLGVRLHPIAEGCPERLVVIVEDVTATVRAQQRLAGAEGREAGLSRWVGVLGDQLSETQRVTGAGVWELDSRSGVVHLSEGLRELLRLPASATPAEQLWQRVHPDDLERARTMAQQTLRTGEPYVGQLRVAGLDGVAHELVVSCRVTPADRPGGRSLWGVTQDVTEVREERIKVQMRADWRGQRRTLKSLHTAMFPRELPEIAGVEFAATYTAAPGRADFGGDWFDVIPVDDGVLLAVGDTAGHDGPATAVMGPVRAVLRAYAIEDPRPVTVLARLNRFLLASYRDDTYVTAVVAHYEPRWRKLTVANAGHPAPLLLTGQASRGAAWLTEPGPALGILPVAGLRPQELILEPGMAMCAYTDGLTDPQGEFVVSRQGRLAEAAAEAYGRVAGAPGGGAPVAQLLAEELTRHMLAGVTAVDDACLAILRIPEL